MFVCGQLFLIVIQLLMADAYCMLITGLAGCHMNMRQIKFQNNEVPLIIMYC